MRKRLDLKKPQTMNEKLNWLKLYNRKPEYTMMVDKYEVKKYISDKIGKNYVIPTLGVWDSTKDLNFDTLPDKFVLKCNHNSGNVILCKNKRELNKKHIINILNKSLNTNFYYHAKEWPYKNVSPKIIAEPYLSDMNNELNDYKFYCFNGYVDCVLICVDRNIGEPKFYFFDKDWNLKRYNKRGKEASKNFTLPKPTAIDKMFEIASVLSRDIPFIRVDLFNVDGRIYFGELTFFPCSGFDKNRLYEADRYFGELINLK